MIIHQLYNLLKANVELEMAETAVAKATAVFEKTMESFEKLGKLPKGLPTVGKIERQEERLGGYENQMSATNHKYEPPQVVLIADT